MDFSVSEASTLIRNLRERNASIYWFDLIVTLAASYGLSFLFFETDRESVLRLVWYAGAVVGLYRLASFIHEVVHLRKGELPGFRRTWNFLAGVPLLLPSFLYESHLEHHRIDKYGTEQDGEYLPLAGGGWRAVLQFYLQAFLLPFLVFFRFALLYPMQFAFPKLENWLWRRMSALVIDTSYRRSDDPRGRKKEDKLVEALCFVRALAIPGLILIGVNEWTRVLDLYVLAVGTIGLNHTRTLIAHRYRSDGNPMSRMEQLGDSLNVEGHWFTTGFLFPLGLRYHALHHLFPGIPYHNLPAAHRILMQASPEGSEYKQATFPGFLSATRALKNSIEGNVTSVNQ